MEIPKDEELLQKTKDELDKLKLALDISSYKQDKIDDRRKSRGETTRLIVITLFAALLSFGTTYIMKIYDHGNSINDDTRKEIQKLLESSDSTHNPEKKLAYACMIGDLSKDGLDATLITKIRHYDSVCVHSNITNASINNKDNVIDKVHKTFKEDSPTGKVITSKLDDNDKELMKLQTQAASNNKTEQVDALKQIKQVNDQATSSVPVDIKTAVQSSTEIRKEVLTQLNTVPDNATGTMKYDTLYPVFWVKKNYYILFANIQVTLDNLDQGSGTARVHICWSNDQIKCDVPIETEQGLVSLNKPLDFSYKGKYYRLFLKRIDHAGVNPFKLAAYLNLAESSKPPN